MSFAFIRTTLLQTLGVCQANAVYFLIEYRMSNKEFRISKFDEVVKSGKMFFSVIPAQAGIQSF